MRFKELQETISYLRAPVYAKDFNYNFQESAPDLWYMFFTSETLSYAALEQRVKTMLGDLLTNPGCDIELKQVQGTLRVRMKLNLRELHRVSKAYIIQNIVRTLIGSTVKETYYA